MTGTALPFPVALAAELIPDTLAELVDELAGIDLPPGAGVTTRPAMLSSFHVGWRVGITIPTHAGTALGILEVTQPGAARIARLELPNYRPRMVGAGHPRPHPDFPGEATPAELVEYLLEVADHVAAAQAAQAARMVPAKRPAARK